MHRLSYILKLNITFKKLRGHGKLSEKNIQDALKEVRLALLEADVNYKVVRKLIEDIRQRAVGQEVLESLTPGQQVIKIVNQELTSLMGETRQELQLTGRTPFSLMLVGLQGSGKTTTMAYRIKYLIEERAVAPNSIRVLMFNRLARVQFQERLADIGIPRMYQPPVDTFHSFAYRLIRQMMDSGVIPASTEFWIDGRGEQIWLYTNIAITNLERSRRV